MTVAVCALLIAACAPIQLLNSLVPEDTYELDRGIAYGAHPRQRLDVYRPLAESSASADAAPLVVFFHGGTWSHGERGDFRFVAEALASHGALVVVPDYRLSPRFRYPAFVEDSALAVKWSLDHARRLGADPKRVYLMGHSSGAYNAAMVALDGRWLGQLGASPGQLAGWIGLAGPYDFLPIMDPEAQIAFDWPDTRPDSQPLAHASAASPPALLIAARDDATVDPQRNTGRMAARLRSAGVAVGQRNFDDLGHVTLIVALASPLSWLGGPVLPPILGFLGLQENARRRALK